MAIPATARGIFPATAAAVPAPRGGRPDSRGDPPREPAEATRAPCGELAETLRTQD